MSRRYPEILLDALHNRGTAFTASERAELGLAGRAELIAKVSDEVISGALCARPAAHS